MGIGPCAYPKRTPYVPPPCTREALGSMDYGPVRLDCSSCGLFAGRQGFPWSFSGKVSTVPKKCGKKIGTFLHHLLDSPVEL